MTSATYPTSYVTMGAESVPYLPLTSEVVECSVPILYEDFLDCGVPGGPELWRQGGFYSPGMCFIGYTAACTETKGFSGGFPIRKGETAVKCVPNGYSCNAETDDLRYATSQYGARVLSAPAFEIRWREDDLGSRSLHTSSATDMPTRVVPGAGLSSTPSMTAIVLTTTAMGIATSRGMTTPSESTGIPVADAATGHHLSVSSRSIVGIAVGSTCGFLAMAFAAIFFVLRRRRAREKQNSRSSDNFRNQGYPDVGLAPSRSPTELDSSPVEPKELPTELEPGRARRNLPHPFRARAKHLSLNNQPVELPA